MPASAGSDSISHSTGGFGIRLARLIAIEDRRQVEAEAIHVHLFHPIAEAVHDHPADDGMIGVERVSRAAVIGVARAVLFENVVGAVVQTAEAERRPAVVAFGGVIEDHVENDLDARPVQRLHHVAKLVHRAERILTRAVALVRRKERDRRISPVVDQSRAEHPGRRTGTPAAVRRR